MIKYEKSFDLKFTYYSYEQRETLKSFIYRLLSRQIDEDNKRFEEMMGFKEECRFSSLADEPCGNCGDCGKNELIQELRDKLKTIKEE